MKEEKHNIKKWAYWFSLAVAIIIVYNVLGNFTSITNSIKNFLGVIMPFGVGLLIAYILYLPCCKIEKIFKKTKKKNMLNKHARLFSIITVYIIAILVCVIIINVILPTVIQSLLELVANVPNYYNTAIEKLNSLPENHILKNEKVMEAIINLKNIDLQ